MQSDTLRAKEPRLYIKWYVSLRVVTADPLCTVRVVVILS